MCSNEIPKNDFAKCSESLRTYTFAHVKPYVYKKVNGKRKRIPGYKIENGVVVHINPDAIVNLY